MNILLIIDEKPHYISCLQTDATVPRVGDHVLYLKKTYSVGKVLWDTDEAEVRVYLFNGQ